MIAKTLLGAGVLALGLAASACGGGESEQAGEATPAPAAPSGAAPAAPAAPAGAVSVEAGKQLYAERCSTCHGELGNGKGPGGAALQPPPRNFTDAAWQRSVSDDAIQKTIAYGGAAVGKSPLMPAQPDLAHDPAKLASLRAYVRSFAP